MKRNIHKNLLGILKSKSVLAISSGLLLVSCGAQMGGYSERDGVYYDPNKDTLPEGVIINGDQGNRVGQNYDYYQNSNIIENAEINAAERDNRYSTWTDNGYETTATDSDWGSFAGNQTNIYSSSWGSPWGWYGGYSPYWGMGSRWGMGMSFGWGNSWGWGGYNSFWNYGWNSPFYYGGFYGSPYWGYGGGYYGNPYWGYGGGYYGNGYYVPQRRSGANGRGFTNNSNNLNKYMGNNSGFRNSNNSSMRNNTSGFRNNTNVNGVRQNGMNSNNGFRNQNQTRSTRFNSQPRPNYNNQQQQPSQNNGGFRSGGFNNSNSNSGGGFRGGSSGGGGMRSGGGGGGFRSGGR